MKSKTVTFLLCAFLGFLGVHRFYTQKIITGVLMLITFGLGGLWQLIDMILIASGRFRDKAGNDLRTGPPDPDQPYAGFGVRLSAMIVDGLIVYAVVLVAIVPMVVVGAISVPTGEIDMSDGPPVVASAAAGLFALGILLFVLLYFVGMHASGRQATVGKRCFAIRLSTGAGGRVGMLRSLWRFIGYAISAFPLYLGFIMAAFLPRKRALHDLLAGTVVVYDEAADDIVDAEPSRYEEPAAAGRESPPESGGGGAGPMIIIVLGLLIVLGSLALSFL